MRNSFVFFDPQKVPENMNSVAALWKKTFSIKKILVIFAVIFLQSFFIFAQENKTYFEQKIEWQSDENADKYKVQVKNIKTNQVYSFETENNFIDFSKNPLPAGSYEFNVTAVDFLGFESEPSVFERFEIMKAMLPEIVKTADEAIVPEENSKKFKIQIDVKNISEDSKVELVNENTKEIVKGTLETKDTSDGMEATNAEFPKVHEGEWHLRITNPGGKTNESSGIKIIDKKTYDARIAAEEAKAEAQKQKELAEQAEIARRAEAAKAAAEAQKQKELAEQAEIAKRAEVAKAAAEAQRQKELAEQAEIARLAEAAKAEAQKQKELAEQAEIAKRAEAAKAAAEAQKQKELAEQAEIAKRAEEAEAEAQKQKELAEQAEIARRAEEEAKAEAEAQRQKELAVQTKNRNFPGLYFAAEAGFLWSPFNDEFLAGSIVPAVGAKIGILSAERKNRFGFELESLLSKYSVSSDYYDYGDEFGIFSGNFVYERELTKHFLLNVKAGGNAMLIKNSAAYNDSESEDKGGTYGYIGIQGGTYILFRIKKHIIIEAGADYYHIFINGMAGDFVSPKLLVEVRW